jgi:MFS transporter, DHA1 family, inner membrane transport protein
MPLAPKTPVSASRLPLLALALASFGIGTTEFVIMGLLPDVAGDLRVTIPQAGLLVTGYASSVAFGSPFLAVATARMDRRKALLLLIGIFILGNLLCALAPNYALLMAARIVTAPLSGNFRCPGRLRHGDEERRSLAFLGADLAGYRCRRNTIGPGRI